ncbi:MAG: hypothetical protein ABW166_14045 [Sedimenticola sp.]
MPNGTRVWIGNISEQQQVRIVNLVTLAATSQDFSTPFQVFSADIQQLPEGSTKPLDSRILIRSQ